MADKIKNTKKTTTSLSKKPKKETPSSFTRASYFSDKDKKTIEFLKKHPIPEKFLKQ